jgi:starch synthase
LKVAFVTPELLTLVRRTNLAEIAESLPRTLRAQGADVRVILPYTRDVDTDKLADLTFEGQVEVPDGDEIVTLSVHQGVLGELPVILLDHPQLFRRRHPYGNAEGPYADNWHRYAVFARGVLEALELIGFKADVIHCLDWTTGLIPILHHLEYGEHKPDHAASKAGTYFAIHNLAMQGSFEREVLPRIGIPHRFFQAIEGVELGGKVNFLKTGAEFATIVGMHSPTQAERVQSVDRGDGLEETFRRRAKELVGVQNGIDYRAWDPTQDPALTQAYGPDDKDLVGKRKCKASLQQLLKLDNGPRTPLIAIVGRFDADSGFDILAEALTPMLERSLQLVMMGPGQPEILERMRTVEQTFSGRCRVIEGYNVNTAHLILAGADMLLLPSHYHASNALCAIAMRYGVVPVAYTHSGLEDTIVDAAADPKKGTGFRFTHYTRRCRTGRASRGGAWRRTSRGKRARAITSRPTAA